MKMLITEKMNEYEKKNMRASYGTIVERYIHDMVLCNKLPEIDPSVWENADFEIDENTEIHQFYLCNLSDYDRKKAQECGLLFTYSNLLDLDVLCVDHYGTSWDYVLTDVELTDDYNEI